MARREKEAEHEERGAPGLFDAFEQFWLAGLGAWARAQEEGSKLFESLVRKGEELEAQKAEESPRGGDEEPAGMEELRERAAGGLSRMEQLVEERVSQVLGRFDVARSSELEALSARIERLEKSLQTLRKERAAAGKKTKRAGTARSESGTGAASKSS